MAPKSITLTFSDRQILHGVLSRQTEVNVKVARMVRELAISFKTDASTKMLEGLNEKARAAVVPAPRWDELINLKKYLGEVNEKLTDANPDATPIVLKDYEEALAEDLKVTIDTVYLVWMRDKLAEIDWTKAKMMTPSGEQRVVDVPVSVAQAVAIACAADAIDRAIASEDVR